MSELTTPIKIGIPGIGLIESADLYLKPEVDETIAELKTENKWLKRALYKACANWALSTLSWLDCIDQGEPRKWSEMWQRCLNKAEEYK